MNNSTVYSDNLFERYFLIPFYFTWMIFYVFILSFYFRHPKEFTNSYYTFVKCLGISDIVQMFVIAYSTVFKHVPSDWFGESLTAQICHFIIICAQFMLGVWPMYLFTLFLAFNRFAAIVCFNLYKDIFSKHNTKALIVTAYVISVCIWGPFAVEKLLHFQPYTIDWVAYVEIYLSIDNYGSLTVGLILTLSYSVTIVYCVYTVKSTTIYQTATYRMEIKMLIQGVGTSVVLIIVNVMFYAPKIPVIEAVFVYYVSCGMNPVVFLIMDKNLRKHFTTAFLGFQKKLSGKTNSIGLSMQKK